MGFCGSLNRVKLIDVRSIGDQSQGRKKIEEKIMVTIIDRLMIVGHGYQPGGRAIWRVL